MEENKCPYCGSDKYLKIGNSLYLCKKCRNKFLNKFNEKMEIDKTITNRSNFNYVGNIENISNKQDIKNETKNENSLVNATLENSCSNVNNNEFNFENNNGENKKINYRKKQIVIIILIAVIILVGFITAKLIIQSQNNEFKYGNETSYGKNEESNNQDNLIEEKDNSKEEKYVLTIKYNDGVTQDKVIIQEYNTNIKINNPTRIGYTFVGWDKEVPSKMPSENLTLEAKWKINQYILTIKYNDGITSDIVIKQDYNSEIEKIPNPVSDNMKFIGWNQTIPTKMPAENLTIEAIWDYDIEYTIEDGYAIICGVDVNATNVVILSSYNGYTTKKIGNMAFFGCTNLTSITIPNTVTSIGNYAFQYCQKLTTITIPDSVVSIGSYAFDHCTKLSNIEIPKNLISIGDHAFSNCTSLISIFIPDSVSSVGRLAFNNYKNLTIYCEAKSQPIGWSSDWNASNCKVVWGKNN